MGGVERVWGREGREVMWERDEGWVRWEGWGVGA